MTQNPQEPPSASIHQLSPPMPVYLMHEEHIPDLPTNAEAPTPPRHHPLRPSENHFHGKLQIRAMDEEVEHRAAWKAGMLGAINVLAAVLAARWTAMMAVAGSILLSLEVMPQPDPYKLGLLGIYCLLVVGPCIWMASRRD